MDSRLLEWARAEGLVVLDSGKAVIFRDPARGTVAWIPHDTGRLEFTLIQLRAAGKGERADALHAVLMELTGESMPGNELGLDLDTALQHWEALAAKFLPRYLAAHRELG